MKKIKVINIVAISLAFAVISSCTSTNVSAPSTEQEEVVEKVVKKEPKPLSVKNKTNQLENDFLAKLADIELKLVSAPKQTFKTREFWAPFVVKAENQNGPVADFDITVSYPVSRKDNSIVYDVVQLKTDADGKISFKLTGAQTFATKDFVTFYPTPITTTSSVVQAAYDMAVKAPWNVKSDLTWYSGLLYVYDFNESGKPTTNSFYLLQNLRNAGVNVGNAPLSNASYFEKPLADLYKDTKEIVGNSQKFMVFGSIKYLKPVEETANGYSCTLVADMSCIDMKTGDTFLTFQIVETYEDTNKYKTVDKCKANLTEKVAEALIYGM